MTALEAARQLLAQRGPAEDAEALLYDRWFHAVGEAMRAYPEPAAYAAIALAARPFEAGWRLDASLPVPPGAVRARRDRTLREVPPLFWTAAAAQALRPAPGDALLLSPWRCLAQGGFWHLWSPVWPMRPPRRLMRWYFQIAEEAEPGFAALIAGAAPLDRAFACKLLCGAHRQGRRDTAVLYAPVAGAAWLDALFAHVAPCLVDRPGPPWTEPVASGITRAEDPGTGQSFGQHRCALLAAVARGTPEALTDADAWQAAVAARFAADGLSVDQPWRQGRPR